MNNSPQTPSAPAVVAERARGIVLAAIMLALFLSSLDQTVVGTALPRIVTDLGGSNFYTWVVTAYLLSSTITVPLYGKLSDVFGRKPLMLFAICLFLLGSALSGLSQNMGELITFRAIQGLGAGGLFPISLAIIGDMYTPRERGRYQGLFGAVFGISFIIGPFIGGWITDNINWHWVFYVNLPVGVAALMVLSTVLHNRRLPNARMRDIDYLGIATFTAGVIPLLIGLTNWGEPNSHGVLPAFWSGPVMGLVGFGLVLLVIFGVVEWKARFPIIPLHLLRNRTVSASNVAVFIVTGGMFSAVIFIPRYFQVAEQMSATKSGYMIWPLLVGLIGTSIASGFFISRTGRYKLMVVLSMVALTIGGLLATQLSFTTPLWQLWIWLAVIGVGVGPAMSAFTTIVQNAVSVHEIGVGTSTMTFFRQIGGSVGLALAGTLFNTKFSNALPAELALQHVPAAAQPALFVVFQRQSNAITGVGNIEPPLQAALVAKGTPVSVAQPIAEHAVTAIYSSFALAVGDLFWIVAAAGVIGFLAALAVRALPLRTTMAAAAIGIGEGADLIPTDQDHGVGAPDAIAESETRGDADANPQLVGPV